MARPTFGPQAMPLVALAIALGLTVAAWGLASVYVRSQTEAEFHGEAQQFEAQLVERMNSYEEVLLAGVALFGVNGGWVSRDQWIAFTKTLDLSSRFPGIQGYGFAERVRASNLSEHVERVRGEGYPQYTVFPEGQRDEYVPAVYLEPLDARNQRAFGFDMFSEATRRAAMERARDTGEPTISGKVRLVQENGTDVQPGFLLYAPVYAPGLPIDTVEQRREALVGYVYSPFRARDFMAGLEKAAPVELALRIYDGEDLTQDSLIFSRVPGGRLGDVERVRVMTLGQHEWTVVEATTATATPAGLSLLPLSVLLGGLLASALLVGVVWALTRTRTRAEALAYEMTGALQARTRELEQSNEALRAFSYVVSHDLKEPVRGIDAYLRVLREDHAAAIPPEARTMLDRAQLASDRLARLLRGLLELSSVDRAMLKPQLLQVTDVIRQDACRSAYETLERERHARVTVEPMPPVLAAPSVLAQALGNLIANAIRHNARERPNVLVHGVAQGGLVEIIVEDDGEGYPEGFVEAFNRGQLPSMGFGLLIAQRAVERLQGRLMLGRGARWGGAAARIILPAAPRRRWEEAPGDASPAAARTHGSTSASR